MRTINVSSRQTNSLAIIPRLQRSTGLRARVPGALPQAITLRAVGALKQTDPPNAASSIDIYKHPAVPEMVRCASARYFTSNPFFLIQSRTTSA
jgi:hypothetical protein